MGYNIVIHDERQVYLREKDIDPAVPWDRYI
jgi:hypothetical protein